ncbi:hypothetical protein ACF1BQ_024885 [Bradyrhizobium sp. RDT10]
MTEVVLAEEYSFEPQPFGFKPKCVTFVEHVGHSAGQGLPIVRIRGLHEFKNPRLDHSVFLPRHDCFLIGGFLSGAFSISWVLEI